MSALLPPTNEENEEVGDLLPKVVQLSVAATSTTASSETSSGVESEPPDLYAMIYNNTLTEETLLPHLPDVNHTSPTGLFTPLMSAIFLNNKSAVKLLLLHGSDPRKEICTTASWSPSPSSYFKVYDSGPTGDSYFSLPNHSARLSVRRHLSTLSSLDAFVLSDRVSGEGGCNLAFLLACIDECNSQLASSTTSSSTSSSSPPPSFFELIYRDELTLEDARSSLRDLDVALASTATQGGRYTPLMCALHYKSSGAVRALVLAGADVATVVEGDPVDVYDTNGSSRYSVYAPHCGAVEILGEKWENAERIATYKGMEEVLRKCVEERRTGSF